MKSPRELAAELTRQWQLAEHRERRLLGDQAWPLRLPVGRPSGRQMAESFTEVRQHVAQWRAVHIGTVEWEQASYRATGEAVELPRYWLLHNPSNWVAATEDRQVLHDYHRLARLVTATDSIFHRLLVRRLALHRDLEEAEVIKAASLALQLEAGCAAGAPLRALSLAGIDSKFFERNRRLITALLDARFEGEVSELGLEGFLDAANENDHWLLLADLDGALLPFGQMRVRDKELAETPLPARRILIVENEQCLHQLPPLPQTIAVLGAGLNLAWMANRWLEQKSIGYWGDLDTWGLTMLARARRLQPHLSALLMEESVFDRYSKTRAVAEPLGAGDMPPTGLTEGESTLYRRLISEERGRLEQEFIPAPEVANAVQSWLSARRDSA